MESKIEILKKLGWDERLIEKFTTLRVESPSLKSTKTYEEKSFVDSSNYVLSPNDISIDVNIKY